MTDFEERIEQIVMEHGGDNCLRDHLKEAYKVGLKEALKEFADDTNKEVEDIYFVRQDSKYIAGWDAHRAFINEVAIQFKIKHDLNDKATHK